VYSSLTYIVTAVFVCKSFSDVVGTFIGTILALVLSGLLCDLEADNGWPLIFYVYGMTQMWQ